MEAYTNCSAMLLGSSAACGAGGVFAASVAATLHYLAAQMCLVQEPWPQETDTEDNFKYDFIVVGGGTAGATLAARLAEVDHFSVLLVEAGGDPPVESIIPGYRWAMKNSAYDWNFTTIDDKFSSQALEGGRQKQPRGKMLGGSGSLNDMVYSRGHPADFDEWAEIVGEEWGWENVLKYYKKTEHMTDEKIIKNPKLMQYHGLNGEIEVTGSLEPTRSTEKFLEAFKEIGFKIVDDMTNPDTVGAGRFSHTIRGGRRDSSLTGLLNKMADKENLVVIKNAHVSKILIEDKKAYGVSVLTENGTQVKYYADKNIILSAGTFNTPKLLLLSGIGPRDHLQEMGIDLVQDLPVGENLHDHVMVNTFIAADRGTCHASPNTAYIDTIQYLHDRSGSLSRSDSMGAYVVLNSTSERNIPDFAIYPTCMPSGTPFYNGCRSVLGFEDRVCAKINSEIKYRELIPLAVVLLKPKSRGYVRLASTNPLASPEIYSGTFNNDEDLVGFPRAIEIAWSLAKTSYFKSKRAKVIDVDLDRCFGLDGADSVRCLAKSMATSAWHAVGTAAMGTVVDDRLRVKGVAGLRVVDASVMPKVTRGNTNAPVVMIAEKAAVYIKEEFLNSTVVIAATTAPSSSSLLHS